MASSGLIKHVRGDLFTAPPGSILVHACNTVGSWGAGIALAFREKYPTEYQRYRSHCKEHGANLVGTCLILPGDGDHDVACLFTSKAYGKRKDSPQEILDATRSAVLDLMRQNTSGKPVHSCRINSGKFGVPWEQTEAILDEAGISVTVYTPDTEAP